MALTKEEIEAIVKKTVEKVIKDMKVDSQKPAPKCEFAWKDDALVLECDSEKDRDRAKDILDKGDVIIKVKPRNEEPQKGR
jgi:hypothetical protein